MEIPHFPKPILALMAYIVLSTIASAWSLSRLVGLNNTVLSEKPQIKVSKTPELEGKIVIDLEGAVSKPGVYELAANSRLIDALEKADGLSENAARYNIAKNFNLAKKLNDEEKIYLPFIYEEGSNNEANQTLINVNSASSTQLDLLPGIGQVTAAKIIERRPYQALEELVSKKAVGQKTFEKIINLIEL